MQHAKIVKLAQDFMQNNKQLLKLVYAQVTVATQQYEDIANALVQHNDSARSVFDSVVFADNNNIISTQIIKDDSVTSTVHDVYYSIPIMQYISANLLQINVCEFAEGSTYILVTHDAQEELNADTNNTHKQLVEEAVSKLLNRKVAVDHCTDNIITLYFC